jgi:hypothetical protein
MKLALVRFAKVVAKKTPGEVLSYDGRSVKVPRDSSPKRLCKMFKKVGLTQWTFTVSRSFVPGRDNPGAAAQVKLGAEQVHITIIGKAPLLVGL